MGLINNYNEFFATYLQPLLRTRFRTSNLSMTSIFIDSTSALITALLPMLRRKVFGVIPQVAKQPQLLSHFIHELMSFDISLRDEWGYDGGSGVEGWKGLTWEVLVKKDWFGRWLEVEKTCKHTFKITSLAHLTFRKSLCQGTKISSTLPKALKSTTKASSRQLRNPPMPPSESTISWKPSPIATALFLPSPRNYVS